MDPITLGLLAFLGYQMTKKKKTGGGGGGGDVNTGAGTETTSKPNAPGSPVLTIDAVKPLLNRVKFTASADGQQVSTKHLIKDTEPTQKKVGSYMLVAVTDPEIRPGEKHPDAVMIMLRNSDNKTVISKRILVEDKKIIDII